MNITFAFGTRPEAIKLAPAILAARQRAGLSVRVLVTAQHREMLDDVLSAFHIEPDADLNLMRPDQSLAALTARAVEGLDAAFRAAPPDWVVVQGDTTTVLCAALAAFYNRARVAHVEAGLRTGDRWAPFPEEINRVLASRLCDLHFAPTELARANLLREGVAEADVLVTGNTVIDALRLAVARVRAETPAIPGLPPHAGREGRRLVLVTAHRRENFGEPFARICAGLRRLAERFPDVDFVYPVHPNPHVRETVFSRLAGLTNVHLIEPLVYLPFVALMDRATLVLTDSGGVQEEAPSLGKPVLVMRDKTERPEGVQAGTARLVGADEQRIFDGVAQLLTDEAAFQAMARAVNPYGDGQAAQRIVHALLARG